MKPVSQMTQIELAAYVNSHLTEQGISVVLSGGAAAAYRSNNRYTSYDIDLVNIYLVPRKKIIDAMGMIGFVEEYRHFKHPDSKWVVEFPKGPLSVGDEPIDKVDDIRFSTGILKILSASDGVKDRLAWFYYYQDQQCLQQAIWIAQSNNVDLAEIERWSLNEGKEAEYKQFLKGLE